MSLKYNLKIYINSDYKDQFLFISREDVNRLLNTIQKEDYFTNIVSVNLSDKYLYLNCDKDYEKEVLIKLASWYLTVTPD